MYSHIPIRQPHPDRQQFIAEMMGVNPISTVPLVEYNIHDSVMKTIHGELLNRRWVDWGNERESQCAYLDNFIQFWCRLGYDFVRFERSLPFTEKRLDGPERSWVDQHRGSIASWQDFETYNWPKIEEYDFFAYEYLNAHLPEGLGLIVSHAGGVYEHLSQIMSFEGLCLNLMDNRELVAAIVERLGRLMTGFYEHILDLDQVIALWPGDDMGYRSGTMISPDDLRQLTLPWHKRFTAMAHRRKLPYFLHSCGNLENIMDELIEDVQIDGKHSFEDAILPVENFYRKYGSRIAVLGGLDINILAAGTVAEVRARTRSIMESCHSGRFAIGSGNSIPDYVTVENYLAMIDERHRVAAG